MLKNSLMTCPQKYAIIVDKQGLHEDYVCHIFRDIGAGPKSTLNSFIEMTKDNWDTVR